MFRVEQRTALASDLIREAVAITRGLWTPLPVDGFYTTINPRKVAPIKVRGREVWGYCYIKAGWRVEAERTAARDLIIISLSCADLTAIAPVAAPVNVPPFGTAWRRWRRKAAEGQEVLL
jgi:hypothetical protein